MAVVRSERPVVSVTSSGPPGPPGASGAGFTHTQSSPAAQWTISHNLGFFPAVELISAGGVEMEALVTHLSVNVTQVDFTSAQAGSARLS